MLQTEKCKYEIFNGGAQIAELVPKMSIDHKNVSVQTGWALKRWLTKKDRFTFPSHPNTVRCNEGRIGESKK